LKRVIEIMKSIKDISKNRKRLVTALCVGILAVGMGYLLFRAGESKPDHPAAHAHVAVGKIALTGPEGKDLQPPKEMICVCPMNCVPPMEKPGNCPVCGMELVEVSDHKHEDQEGPPKIKLAEESVRAAGIQVAPVEKKFVTKETRLFGKIEYDPVEQYKVSAYAPGVIDRIYVKRAGQTVRAGDPLFDIHSAELYYLEQELFEVLKHFPSPLDYRPARGQRYRRLMRPPVRRLNPAEAEGDEEKKAALEKLPQIQRKMRLLGLSKEDIDDVMAKGQPNGISTVITPTTGIVLEQYAFKGSFVNTGETIFTIANPRYMWARLDAYESDFPWIRIGQDAEFETDAFPGEIFQGKVTYLDPYFDADTRTFDVGVLYTDKRARLKPNMLVRCNIRVRMTAGGVGVPGKEAEEKAPLVIPDTAPLITGKRAVVYVEMAGEPGTYEPREVMLGPKAKSYYVVKHGLKKGEKVVVNGNFKIDSAVQILAKPSMMEPKGKMTSMEGHQHMGMQPMQTEHKLREPAAGHQDVMSATERRERLSEIMKSRSRQTSEQMHKMDDHSAVPDQRDEEGEQMKMEMEREAAERGVGN
jgi:Cu(I)/Ag(I) efflux system membrane fusion protein